MIRLFSVFYRNWLECSLLTGFGTEWQETGRLLHPHLDLGMRLRFGIPIGVSLTTLYTPGVAINFPASGDHDVSVAYAVLRNQLSLHIHWFTFGAAWTSDIKTALMQAAENSAALPVSTLPAHTLSGFIELFY